MYDDTDQMQIAQHCIATLDTAAAMIDAEHPRADGLRADMWSHYDATLSELTATRVCG